MAAAGLDKQREPGFFPLFSSDFPLRLCVLA
jgi:hypothetical protein